MTDLCSVVDDRAAELALDIVDEPERTELLAHAESCERCRRTLDDLADTADRILLAAPEVEPPVGFESRATAVARDVTARTGVPAPAKPVRRSAVVVAIAAALVAIIGGVAIGGIGEPSTPAATNAPALGGSGELASAAGDHVGEAAIVVGSEPILVMSLDDAKVGERYECHLVFRDGTTIEVGTWAPRGPNHTWSIPIDRAALDAVQLVVADADGSSVATADLT